MQTTLRTPKTCVSLSTDNIEVLRGGVDRALGKADYAEMRFNFFARDDIDTAVRAVEHGRDWPVDCGADA